jgi:hypothetical protein
MCVCCVEVDRDRLLKQSSTQGRRRLCRQVHTCVPGLCVYVPCLLLVCLCRILQTESEALSCDDGVLLDLNQLLDIRLQQAVALR